MARGDMSLPLEDYALIGDVRTAALVGRNGSIDWLCLPRFDSGACFAALLGDHRNGRWLIEPLGGARKTTRRYRPGTLVLETTFETEDGVVRLIDCMPPDENVPNVVRVVEGVRGSVAMRMELVIRFDYGWLVPWVRTIDGVLHAVGGPDALTLRTPVEVRGQDLTSIAEFTVREGDQVPFVLTWHASVEPAAEPPDALEAIRGAERWWRGWSSRCAYDGQWRDEVVGSLVTLKALTHATTGGVVAAATTSLPERIGGVRNWDYRFCWLRDATFTLYALVLGGYREEAGAWRDWLLRAVAGAPSQLQTLYGIGGERRIPELTLDWLPGYAASRPVRVGNVAVKQLQLDVYGEVSDALYQARTAARNGGDLEPDPFAWAIQKKMLDFLEGAWTEPDEGIWEVRGPRQHFTHSKMLVWVAFDRAVKCVERLGLDGPAGRWRALRGQIHEEICTRAFDAERGAFTQAYDSKALDASLLLAALVGFLPPTDERIVGTVRAIERELMPDGLVRRYHTHDTDDGLPPGEGVFLACSFWLADNYALMGRRDDARALYERLLALRNDVGLLAEEYDPESRRLVGNFPQAFSHVGLVNTAFNLRPRHKGPAEHRKDS